MTVYKPRNSRFYHYDFQRQGKRYHGSTGVETMRKAEAYERRVREQLAAGVDPDSTDTLDYGAGRYWAEVGQGRKSARQIKHRLAIVVRLIGANTRLTDITTSTVSKAIERRRGEVYARGRDKAAKAGRPAERAARYDLKNATVNSDIVKPLRAILTRARDVWEVKGLPAINWKGLTLPEAKTPIVHFADDYQRRWLAACGPTEGFALQLLLRYGMRFGELFFPPAAFLPDAPGGPAVAVNERKGGEPMLVHLTAEDARQIAARAGQAVAGKLESIWIERNRKGDLVTVSYGALQGRLRTAAKRAGVDHRRLIHATRHHVGTDVLAKTGDLAMAKKMLNHADIKSTLVYAHALDQGLRAVIESRNSPEAAGAKGEFVVPVQSRRRK